MRLWHVLILGLLIGLLAAACSETGAAEEPAGAVQGLMGAIQEQNFEAAADYLCQERRAEFEQGIDTSFAELEALGLERQQLLDTYDINLEDMAYEELNREGDAATVGVIGRLSVTFNEEALGNFIDDAATASGEEVSDEQVAAVVQSLVAAGGEDRPIDAQVRVVEEEDAWRVCDDLGFLNQTGIFQMP